MSERQTVLLEEIRGRSVEEVLREVAQDDLLIVVRLPDGDEVTIEARARLRPLPVLEGTVPSDWKEAVNASGV